MIIGDVGTLQVIVEDTGGNLQDPTSVGFFVLQPDGTVITTPATRTSLGVYFAEFAWAQSGSHWVKAIGTGPAYPFASQMPIVVTPSAF